MGLVLHDGLLVKKRPRNAEYVELCDQIKRLFPKACRERKIDLPTFFDALQHKAESQCSWQGLQQEFDDWEAIRDRFYAWRKKGLFEDFEGGLRAHGFTGEFPWSGLDIKKCRKGHDS